MDEYVGLSSPLQSNSTFNVAWAHLPSPLIKIREGGGEVDVHRLPSVHIPVVQNNSRGQLLQLIQPYTTPPISIICKYTADNVHSIPFGHFLYQVWLPWQQLTLTCHCYQRGYLQIAANFLVMPKIGKKIQAKTKREERKKSKEKDATCH